MTLGYPLAVLLVAGVCSIIYLIGMLTLPLFGGSRLEDTIGRHMERFYLGFLVSVLGTMLFFVIGILANSHWR